MVSLDQQEFVCNTSCLKQTGITTRDILKGTTFLKIIFVLLKKIQSYSLFLL